MSVTAPSFRDLLPRLYALKDMLPDVAQPDAYFQNFEERLSEYKSKRNAYVRLEHQLAALDSEAWADLKGRAVLVLQKREPGRGWRRLFDVFSEARAFGYLMSSGCTAVRFIPRRKGKTPDLFARRNGKPVFCEVKTINVSTEEADRRRRVHEGQIVGSKIVPNVGTKFLTKLTSTLEYAIGQLDAVDPERNAERLIFTVVHFDDWVGDYQPEYFAQIDAHLLQNPLSGAHLVFCPASNLFECTFTMRSATVLSE